MPHIYNKRLLQIFKIAKQYNNTQNNIIVFNNANKRFV